MICPNCPCPDECLQWPVFCEWAAKNPSIQSEIRHICARSRSDGEVPPTYPSVTPIADSRVIRFKPPLGPELLGWKSCLYSSDFVAGCCHSPASLMCHWRAERVDYGMCSACITSQLPSKSVHSSTA